MVVYSKVDFQLIPARIEDSQLIADQEANSYPNDEAASEEKIRFRILNAGEYFYCYWLGEELIGFVNGTLCFGDTLTHESMSEHLSSGQTLCIHSVVIVEHHRYKGFGSSMLKQYVNLIKRTEKHIQRILLIAKEGLIPFYEKCGFQLVGKSGVVHGKEQWFELKLQLSNW